MARRPTPGHDPPMPAPKRIYLDNAATTRPLPAVVDAMAEAHLEHFGNPSSSHSFGHGPKKALDDAREFLRGTLSAAQVVLTSGGSEADYLGILGSASVRPPGRVLMARSDHPAILECAKPLGQWRHYTEQLPVSRFGDLEPETLFDALGTDVRTVAIQHGHNELGTLTDLEELTGLIRRVAPEAHIHVDLVQTYGKLPFDLDAMDVDSVAVSAHKLHGPRGVGFLALSSKARIAPLQLAGGQEGGLRGGTENVAGAVGMMLAADAALSRQAQTAAQTSDMVAIVERAVQSAFPDAEVLGHPERRLPHILSLRIPGVVGETLMMRGDARGLAFSIGAACHGATDSGSGQRGKPDNHVHAAIGMTRQSSREVVRISFSGENTMDEAETAAEILVEEAQHILDAAPRGRASRRSTRS